MPLQNRNIVVIDDTASIRTFLRISLQACGALFHEAASANEGLKVSSEVKPDLVVLDLGLPDRDGFDILPELKTKDDKGFSPKVIILSVRKESSAKEKALKLGADGYMTKPFLMDDLIELIDRTINR